ncbi:MAG: RIP metalloprotease RseP [Desulfovibrio sp.]|jgi:regulator of sigma E protease|nr:RIP metalloprotease RseP [Desulfovibrio sp.]
MSGILATILVFAFLIFFHELGHFLLARALGIGVRTFSLGFGPVLFARTVGKTVCQLAAVPLGGFVSLVGETPDMEIAKPFTPAESFSLRPARQRFLVILAGPVFNLLLAWFLCWGLLWANGLSETPPVVGAILENSPAASSPLRPGDRVLSLNGTPVRRWEDMPRFLRRNGDRPITFVVAQEGAPPQSFVLAPALLSHTTPEGETFTSWGIGILPGQAARKELSFFQAAAAGFSRSADMVVLIWSSLADLVSGRESAKNIGGPLLIVQALSQQADHGLINLLLLTALISVNLGILNLLPIPVLDGGHLFFLAFEALFRRPVPFAIQEKAMLGGLLFLIGLMLFATFNDIVRLLGGPSG